MPTPAVELEIGQRTVRVTSPDKLYFPDVGLTKLDVVNYYVTVGDGIFAALQDRPTTMERWPGGYRPDVKLSTRSDSHGEAFYQKRAPEQGDAGVGADRHDQPSRPAGPPTRCARPTWPPSCGWAISARCASIPGR